MGWEDNGYRLFGTRFDWALIGLVMGNKAFQVLYRERYDGLAGGYPVETLERQWRGDQKERKFLSKRGSISTTISNFTQQQHITIETAVKLSMSPKKTLPAQQVFALSCRT
ncbi:hypothetical protein [Absidia glauca]|uniref:Transcription activator GCR1-like domain-containing protein n=1 Tax=Absidia glauca TaxID=4829 RepID=A0A163JGG9_ABSGL|nr:hypothetical protein [Absidia glauca]